MTNRLPLALALALALAALAAALLAAVVAAPSAHAVPIGKCVRVVHNPQVNREALVNTCKQCVVAKIERRRPGTTTTGQPSMRDFTLPPGATQPLPFKGTGKTRVKSEMPCPQAR